MNQINTSGLYIIIIGIVLSLFLGNIAQRYRDKCTLDNYTKKRHNKKGVLFMALSCIAMWLPSAIRYNVGIDNDNYQIQFDAMTEFAYAFIYFEPGYGLLCYLCKTWFNDYQVLIFTTAMLTGGLLWRSIYKFSNNIVLCILGCIAVNMYFMSYTVIRQFISIAILTNSIQYVQERKLIKFLIVCAIAASFHYTSLIFIIVYLSFSKNERIITWKNSVLLVIFLMVYYNIDNLLGNIYILFSALRDGYSTYENADITKDVKEIIFLAPIIIYSIVYRKDLLRQNNTNGVLFWLVILLVIIKIIGIMSPGLSRTHYYFVFCIPFLLSYATNLKSTISRQILPILIILYYTWSISLIFYYQWEDFLPYQTIFQK